MIITAAHLKKIAPSARADMVAAIVRGWPEAEAGAKLTTLDRASGMLANIMTETGGLTILSESGAYSAPRILEIFGEEPRRSNGRPHHSAAVKPAEARRIGALPVAQRGPVLFDRVYGIGNPTKAKEFGHTQPGDGWKFRGGGMMQKTGGNAFKAFQKKTGIKIYDNPELLRNPDTAFKAAWMEWIQDGRCNKFMDNGNLVGARKVINGGTNGMAECNAYFAKIKRVLRDFTPSAAPASVYAEPDGDVDPKPYGDVAQSVEEAPSDAAPSPPAGPDSVQGDPVMFSTQTRLKKMNYNPGIPNGVWGGMSAGAITGFINDRHLEIVPPSSAEDFAVTIDTLSVELARAEAENWKRPVSEERASGDAAVVAKVAPEVVPVKRNFLATIWAAISAFFIGIYNAVSGYVSDAWNFFTDHKDNLPSTDSGFFKTAMSWVSSVPVAVWFILGGMALVLLALGSKHAADQITKSVQTGARQ